jgi:hypothetical protein
MDLQDLVNEDVTFLISVIASSHLLQIAELRLHSLFLLKQKINSKNIIPVILMLVDKEYGLGEIRDYLFTYLCSKLIDEIQLEYGLVFSDQPSESKGFNLLN